MRAHHGLWPRVAAAVALALLTGMSGHAADYAVVVSAATSHTPGWQQVVAALVGKHSAATVVYPHAVTEALPQLRRIAPLYACFVARPEELGCGFVVDVNRLTRALNGDPYGDVIWGIVTGYEASDALRLARQSAPLTVRRAAAGTPIDLGAFNEGAWYSEGEKGVVCEKQPGKEPQKRRCPDDSTQSLVNELNANRPDYFQTSGHASQHDWQIGYSYHNGQFRCKAGQLFGLDTHGARFDVNSPNPKVYAPLGNCLIGLIDGRDTMALAWMRTGGVCQMAAYVVPTWYGTAWGIADYFVGEQGSYTYAQSFFLNNQFVVRELRTRFPDAARLNIADYDMERNPRVLDEFAAANHITDRDALGLLWDRDTVAFYGDPAWEARVAKVRPAPWNCALSVSNGRYTFRVTANTDGTWGRPPAAIFPKRLRDIRIVSGADLDPLITERFILLPLKGRYTTGETFTVEFTARAH